MQRTDLRFDIPDMKCAGCADRVETVLGRAGGVRSASVDLEEKRARVTYDAGSTTPEDLLAAVERAGYSLPRS